jgi:hypothetical protein
VREEDVWEEVGDVDKEVEVKRIDVTQVPLVAEAPVIAGSGVVPLAVVPTAEGLR